MYEVTPKMEEMAKLLDIDIIEVISAQHNVIVDFLVKIELDLGDVSSERAQKLSEIANIDDVIIRCIQTRDFALANELMAGEITEDDIEKVFNMDRVNDEKMDLKNEEPEVEVVVSAYYISKDKLKECFALVKTTYKRVEIINSLMTA